MSQLVLADAGWPSGSHCKPQAYGLGGRGGAGSGRWARTFGYFSSCGADTSEDPAGGGTRIDHGGQPIYSCEGQLS